MSKMPIRVVVTGAAGQISYSLLGLIAKGDVFGQDQPVDLVMLDLPFAADAMAGVVMELQDCAFPNLNSIKCTTDQTEAFTDIDIAVLVGAFPRKPGMERKDMLAKNAEIFQAQGKFARHGGEEDGQSACRRQSGEYECAHRLDLCAVHSEGKLFGAHTTRSKSRHRANCEQSRRRGRQSQECVHLGQPLGDAISGRVEWHRGEGRQVHHRRPRSKQ